MKPEFDNGVVRLYEANALSLPLEDASVDCVVTSPPYWGLRDYGNNGQLGLESTPEAYVANMVAVFREVWRVLKSHGTVWLNLGDSYAGDKSGGRNDTDKMYPGSPDGLRPTGKLNIRSGLKSKDLIGTPWRVAFALQADGWWLRSDIIWSKPNPMPESVIDRPTKAHEYVFLLTKNSSYYYDAEAIKERKAASTVGDARGNADGHRRERGYPGAASNGGTNMGGSEGERNKRTVWDIATQPYSEAHFATFPEALVRPCILAGTSEKGVCSVCGKPWERVLGKPKTTGGRGSGNKERMVAFAATDHGRINTHMGSSVPWEPTTTPTVVWLPTCTHDAPTVPATVLDPFSGSGTTAMVAQKLGRRAVGTDLSAEYIAMAAKRIGAVTLPMALFSDIPESEM